jgi:CBS domain-containing protein
MNQIQDLRIEHVMTPAPACIDEGCTLAGALCLLLRQGYQSAPVTGRGGEVVGLLTRAGLLTWLGRRVNDADDVTLRQLLQTPVTPAVEQPLRIEASAPLRELSRRLVADEAAAALVVRDGRVVGIVTLLDVARAVAHGDVPSTPRPAHGHGHCFTADGLPESPTDEAAERELMTLLLAQRT